MDNPRRIKMRASKHCWCAAEWGRLLLSSAWNPNLVLIRWGRPFG